jgi:hypothetical protein
MPTSPFARHEWFAVNDWDGECLSVKFSLPREALLFAVFDDE